MKKLILLLSCSFITIELSAQAPTFKWAKSLGGNWREEVGGVTTDASSNVYTIGSFSSDTADFDPGTSVFNVGRSGSTGSGTGGYSDIFISKLDSNGNFAWVRTLGSTQADIGLAITTDAAGNIYVTGLFMDTVDFDPGPGVTKLISAGKADVFVAKFSAAGNLVWAKNFGGTGDDQGNTIQVDSKGDIYLGGFFNNDFKFNPSTTKIDMTSIGNRDVFISKLNSSGNLIWAKQYGGAFMESISGLAVNSLGEVYISGNYEQSMTCAVGAGSTVLTTTSSSTFDFFVSKLDASGKLLWAKNSGTSSYNISTSLAIDSLNNVYVSGSFTNTSDFDPSPSTSNLTSFGSSDIFILKLDNLGKYQWAKQIGGTNFDQSGAITIDRKGNLYLTGFYRGTADFDPNATSFLQNSLGGLDIFVSCVDSSGKFLWAKSFGSIYDDRGINLTLDKRNNIYTVGSYTNTVDFNPDAGVSNITTAGLDDIFIHRMSQNLPTSIGKDLPFYNQIKLYPNPTTDHLIIENGFEIKCNAKIVSVYGQELMTFSMDKSTIKDIDVSALSSGIYWIVCQLEGGHIVTEKIIKN